LYNAATVASALVTAEEPDDAPDPEVVPAAADELPADDEPPAGDELLLPQAATVPHAAMTAAIVPTRLRILHTPFSIDLSPPTHALSQHATQRQARPATSQSGEGAVAADELGTVRRRES